MGNPRVLILCWIAFASLGPGASGAGEDTTVEARVDATRIGEGDALKLTIEVRGSHPPHVRDPDLSGLADFTIASGPSVSTSTSMVWSGGQAASTTSKQYTYVLFPRRKGTLTIPAISVMLGSRVVHTDPIGVEVVEGRIRKAPAGPTGRMGPWPGARRDEPQPAGEIFVESKVDRKQAYVGEQILLTYKVYTQLDLVEVPTPQQLPSYTGFWVEEIPVDPRVTIHRVTRDGKDFVEITLMKKAIFPTASGDLTIEETTFGMPVKVDTRDPFDSIFFTPTRTLYRKTTPHTIHVKPLPETGRPASFTGAVGSYTLSVETDRAEARVNDALGLKIVVKGSGNMLTVGEPLLPPLPDYKKYAPRVEEAKDLAKDRLQGRKSWDYVLTPLAPGPQDIPPVRLAYFDPARAAYVELTSQRLSVQVLRSGPGSEVAGGASSGARREVTAFGRDVRYIKPVADLAPAGAPFHRSPALATLLAAPLMINAALLLAVKRRERLRADAGLTRGMRAPAFARRRLKEARRLLGSGRSRDFHQEVGRAVACYVGDKLNVPPSGLTHERIERMLQERGVSEGLRAELRGCLEMCDYARFAPVAPGQAEMTSTLERAEQIIARLERRLSGRATQGEAV